MDLDNINLILNNLHQQKFNSLDCCDGLSNNNVEWRNNLDYKLLSHCLKHSSEKIKISVLSLVIDSHKSTLSFSEEELKLIHVFIKFNLGKKFDFIPLLKKGLQRLNNSTASLQRNLVQAKEFKTIDNYRRLDAQSEFLEQSKIENEKLVSDSMHLIEVYRTFFITLRDTCLDSIFLGATHTRTENSLLLLKLQHEIWPLQKENEIFEWSTGQVNKLFQCLVLNTYESSKIIAYDIILGIKPSILQLDLKEKVQEIFDVAVKLANSMRPIDSITAAYMLKVCMMSSVIGEIIEFQRGIENKDDVALQLIIVLLQCLEEPTILTHSDMIRVISKYSLYGYIFCIRIILSHCDIRNACNEYWQRVITKIIEICLFLNTAVSTVVNSSSPEGYFPIDSIENHSCMTENESEIIMVTPQMVLLCSWRTVKETSLLFGYMMEKLPVNDNNLESGSLSLKNIMKIGNYLVTLLCETKHRGAFEQAYVGFNQFCSRLWGSTNKQLNELPKIWLYQLLTAITGLTTRNSKFCATRRSAGVPFMVQAFVTSESSLKNNEQTAFHSTMRILLGLSVVKNENELSVTARKLIDGEHFFTDLKNYQNIDSYEYSWIINPRNGNDRVTIIDLKVHILNILRALFKNARLRNSVLAYAADGLMIAVKNYNSKTWAERNAATLLFSALVIRIFGVQRTKEYIKLDVSNKMTLHTFFEKYPRLQSFTLTELKLFIDSEEQLIRPSIQSTILLLSRLYLSGNIDNSRLQWKIDEFVELVSQTAKSMVCTTRELAARAIVPLLTQETVCRFINKLFYNIQMDPKICSVYRWNLIHGYLLQILQIARSNLLTTGNLYRIDMEKFFENSMWIIKDKCWTSKHFICYPVAAVFIDVVDEFFRINKHSSGYVSYTLFHRILEESMIHFISDEINYQFGKEVFEYSTVKFFINLEGFTKLNYSFDEWLRIWTKIISHSNSQIQILGWFHLKNLIYDKYIKSNSNVSPPNSDIQYSLLSVAIAQGFDRIKQKIFNRELLAAVQEFLYQVYDNKVSEELRCTQIEFDFEICLILVDSVKKKRGGVASTFKLFGRIYGKILKHTYSTNQDNLLNISQLSSLVYEAVFYNSWTSSSEIDCRLAIAEVMHDIYMDTTIDNWQYSREYVLDWWTTLLHLMVDDSVKVQELGLLTLVKLKLGNNNMDDCEPLDRFFEIFSETFCNENDTAFAAYFFWSTSLSNKNSQINKSDVFNECYNYNAYEPLQISKQCHRNLKKLTKDNIISQLKFTNEVQKWLSKRLNIASSKCIDVKTLISTYKCYLPSLNGNLYDVLDPTYKEKFLLSFSLTEIENFVCQNQ